MKVAVVDIGSNAVRCTFYGLESTNKDTILLKKLSYVRLPIRLGTDVFVNGKISEKKYQKLLIMALAFKHLCKIHEVIDYRLVATSAMREAANGNEVIAKIHHESDIQIELLSGDEEAEIISESVFLADCVDPSQSYMLIDVGGGSTEITFLSDGQRRQARSFKLGSVRAKEGLLSDKEWKNYKEWIGENAAIYKPQFAIGTGGNINKLHKLCGLKSQQFLSLEKLKDKISFLKSCTQEELLVDVKLKTDRADVIIPASKIYSNAMEKAKLDKILVP